MTRSQIKTAIQKYINYLKKNENTYLMDGVTMDRLIQSLNRHPAASVNKAVEMFGTGKIKSKDKAFAKKTLKDLLKGSSMR